jgi:hypothetical protein
MHLRMMTSSVRHHTVVHRPIIGMVHEGALLNNDAVIRHSHHFFNAARDLTIGRHLSISKKDTTYNPIGYEISAQKAEIDRRSGSVEKISVMAQQARARAAMDRITIL